MAGLDFHQTRQNQRRQAHRPFLQAMPGAWDNQDHFGLATGITLTGIGMALVAGFALTQFANAASFGFLFLFFGCPFLVFGGVLVLLGCVEFIFRRLKRIQSHCGRCRFYQALDAGYALGRCRVDPLQRVVQRTNGCRFFEYSERAMVRDRFAQQAKIDARTRGNNRIHSSL
ncbi:MAG TPA: hypothetical protein VKT82_19600 [Ktedonobacterales bacterium]|nr:hypothetical protein [Ktedonobacterales bacterium]